jgi:hypothetical protein
MYLHTPKILSVMKNYNPLRRNESTWPLENAIKNALPRLLSACKLLAGTQAQMEYLRMAARYYERVVEEVLQLVDNHILDIPDEPLHNLNAALALGKAIFSVLKDHESKTADDMIL